MKEKVVNLEIIKDRSIFGMILSLSLFKKLIDRYNGEIWVDNKISKDYSKGTILNLLIPCV